LFINARVNSAYANYKDSTKNQTQHKNTENKTINCNNDDNKNKMKSAGTKAACH
jgi:hypothetical protein